MRVLECQKCQTTYIRTEASAAYIFVHLLYIGIGLSVFHGWVSFSAFYHFFRGLDSVWRYKSGATNMHIITK